MIVSFFGHADFSEQNKYKEVLLQSLISLVKTEEKVDFYLGGYGNFDNFAHSVCRALKVLYKNVSVNFITPYLGKYLQLRPFLLNEYDEIIFPDIEKTPKKFAILKRNEWMINKSDYIFCYVNRSFGGAWTCLKQAEKKNKKIINLYNL